MDINITYKDSKEKIENLKKFSDSFEQFKNDIVTWVNTNLSKYQPKEDTKVILIDEVQFFSPKDIDILVDIADSKNIPTHIKVKIFFIISSDTYPILYLNYIKKLIFLIN